MFQEEEAERDEGEGKGPLEEVDLSWTLFQKGQKIHSNYLQKQIIIAKKLNKIPKREGWERDKLRKRGKKRGNGARKS